MSKAHYHFTGMWALIVKVNCAYNFFLVLANLTLCILSYRDRKLKRFVGDSGDGPKKMKTESGNMIKASFKSNIYSRWAQSHHVDKHVVGEEERSAGVADNGRLLGRKGMCLPPPPPHKHTYTHTRKHTHTRTARTHTQTYTRPVNRLSSVPVCACSGSCMLPFVMNGRTGGQTDRQTVG